MNANEATFEEYKALVTRAMTTDANIYVEREMREYDALCGQIEAIEAAHPEYEEAL